MSNINTDIVVQGKAVIHLFGRIDVSLSVQIEDEMNEFISSNNIKSALINMQDVEYLSSSGFRMIISVLRTLKNKGGSLKLCNIKSEVQRIFDLVELTSLFDIFLTEEEALKEL